MLVKEHNFGYVQINNRSKILPIAYVVANIVPIRIGTNELEPV
jgi:hypothetical protein